MNRIAVEADKAVYGPYITVGDVIIDSPTKLYPDGSREVIYYFIGSKDLLAMRENAVIWIDGDKLGFTKKIVLRNTANEQTPWHIKSATIKNIPHTKVTTGGFSCHGLSFLTFDFVSDQFPGLMRWEPSRKFMTGHFGLHVKASNMFGGHCVEASVINGGRMKFRGLELQYGFSCLRLSGNNYDVVVDEIDIENFYFHDTGHGEGFYLGATHAPPLAKLKNLKIKNGVLARTAAEAIQVQHLIGGADIKDVIIYRSASNWLNAFQPYQDGGVQWNIASGLNKFSNVIIDGFACNGFAPLGSDQNLSQISGSTSIVDNVLFHDGGNGMYLHNSAKFGVNWIYRNLYFAQMHNLYFSDRTGEKVVPHLISKKWGTDNISFESIIHDGSREKVFENITGLNIGTITQTSLPAPEYVKSGFVEKASRIMHWHQFIGPYFDASKIVVNGVTQKIKYPTRWYIGDIAIDARSGGTYLFFKCLQDHISDATVEIRPSDNNKFLKLTWDENGIRNDQPGWNSALKQSMIPPDDLRLVRDSYWKNKEFGIKGIIQREDILDEYVFNGERVIVTDKTTYKTKL